MQVVLPSYRLLVLTLVAFAELAGPVRADERQREFVPEANAFVNLSDRTRLFLLGDVTRNTAANTKESEYGAHLDVTLEPIFRPELRDADWERNRYFWTRIGYAQLGTPDKASSGPTERRGIVELTGRMPLPQDVWLVHRGRVDLRDIGGEFSKRWRIEPYLARQNDSRSTSGNVDRAGLVLKYYH